MIDVEVHRELMMYAAYFHELLLQHMVVFENGEKLVSIYEINVNTMSNILKSSNFIDVLLDAIV